MIREEIKEENVAAVQMQPDKSNQAADAGESDTFRESQCVPGRDPTDINVGN